MERDLTIQEARGIARLADVKLPRMGYEVYLGAGFWLSSNLHFQFGSFGKPANLKPYRITAARSYRF